MVQKNLKIKFQKTGFPSFLNKKVLGFLIVLLFLISIIPRVLPILLNRATPQKAQNISGPSFSQSALWQGDTLIIRIDNATNTPSNAYFGSEPITFFSLNGSYFAVIGIDANAKPGNIFFSAGLASGEKLRREFIVHRYPFPMTKLILPEKLAAQGVKPKDLISNIAAHDKPILFSIFKSFAPLVYFNETFKDPLPNWVDVGNFGVFRQFDGGGVRHLGVDLQAKMGDPVFSINAGIVDFSGDLPDFGNTVIVDHGMGIFSGYLHLSEITVQLHSKIKKGDIVGRVGSTGEYSLEPHLHFTVKIHGANVDPKRFLDATKRFL